MTERTRAVRVTLAGFVALLVVTVATARPGAQPAPPALTGPVNDFAGVIDAQSQRDLDTLIRRLLAASGDTVVVATVKTFEPWGDIRSYATEMFENHGRGIGQKGRDNGLLVLLAVDDRRVWVEVGYDLEGIITDGFSGETSREVMTPYFREGRYGPGLVAGVTRLAQRIAEARKVTLDGVPSAPARPRASRDSGIPLIVWLFLAIVLINVISAIRRGGRRRRRGRWYSHVGPFGGGYGGWTHGGGGWSGGGSFGGGFGGFGGGRSGGGGGGASW
jgi:uncharacterized protein